MSEDYTSSLQNTVLAIIRNELLWSDQCFKRVAMSENADGKPAELYGTDGKIYYRKDGDLVGSELDAGGSSSLWEVSGSNIAAVGNAPVILDWVYLDENTLDMSTTFWIESGGGGSGGHPRDDRE